jgi:hypothetical protein
MNGFWLNVFLSSWVTKLILIEMVRIHENCYFDIKKYQHYLILEKKSKWRSWLVFTNLHLWIYRKDFFIWFQINQNCTQKNYEIWIRKKFFNFHKLKSFYCWGKTSYDIHSENEWDNSIVWSQKIQEKLNETLKRSLQY